MRIFRNIDELPRFERAVVTSGFFDGVHLGHQKVLRRLCAIAQQKHGETALVTFWPHPRMVVGGGEATLRLLHTPEEKHALLAGHGVQNLIEIPFTPSFAEVLANTFIQETLVGRIGVRHLIVGHDYRFGKGREGDFAQLEQAARQYGFAVEEVSGEKMGDVTISSSKIRHALLEGEVDAAARMLGRSYTITGRVVAGEKVGRTLGFPTANMNIDSPYKLIPKDGIYAASVVYKSKTYGGMLYIGARPTLQGRHRSIEVNIFEFQRDIYSEELSISPVRMIREDIRFDSLSALKKQIEADRESSLAALEQSNLI